MRIAILHPRMDIKGGAENIVIWLGNGLQQRGHQVTVLSDKFNPNHWPQELVDPLEVQILPNLFFSKLFNSNTVRFWERSRQLGVILGEFDLVIAQHFPFYCWAAESRERKGGEYKIVWLCQEPLRRLYPHITDKHLLERRSLTPEGVVNEYLDEVASGRFQRTRGQQRKDNRNRRWDANGASRCDLVVTNSAFTAENVHDIFNIEAVVCHLGIPLPPQREYTHGNYAAILTTLAARKNVPNMIRAVAELIGRGRSDIRMKIGGRGPDREKLEKMTAELGVSNNLEFVGGLRDQELPEFYANARMVVYCPIDEPFGLVPLEASAVKTPSVVSNHGGPAEIIENGVTGLHANPFDPVSIADAIEKLWDDQQLCRKLAEAACQRTREYYSLDEFVIRFEKILAENLWH